MSATLAWARLRANAQGDGIFEIPSIPAAAQWAAHALRFALGRDGLPRLLVPIDGSHHPPTITETRNLVFHVFRARAAGVSGLYLDILCLNHRLTSVFADFCDSVIDRVANGDDPAMAVKATVEEFRALFIAVPGQELSGAERIGLLGELWMLENLVSKNPALLDAWTGPAGQRHDFRRAYTAIEIKTSAKRGAERIMISSIEQLAPPDGGTLYLWRPVFEPVMGGATSIPSLLERILFHGVERDALRHALASMKLDLDSLMATEKTMFAFEGVSAYRVEHGFPRLSLEDFRGHLPSGVVSLQYEIDLGAAKPWKLGPDDMRRVMEDFCK